MKLYLKVYFPVENARLAAILAAANECWPGCWSGVRPDCVVVTDLPDGADPTPAARAVEELLNPSGPKGQRWGERAT